MKPDHTIKNIAIAAVNRKSIDLQSWENTFVEPSILPDEIALRESEIGLVLFRFNDENWTLITTQRILGKMEAKIREVKFGELDDVIYGLYKNPKVQKTTFRVVDFYGDSYDFLMETGKPAIAFIYGVDIVLRLHRTSA